MSLAVSLDAEPAAEDIVEITGWAGPDEEVGLPPGDLDVEIIRCATRRCDDLAGFIAEGSSDVHWKPHIIGAADGAGGVASAVEEAITRSPDVIFVVGAAPSDAAEALRGARHRGVIVIEVSGGDGESDRSDGIVDLSVSDQSGLVARVDAYAMIAATGGTANVLVVRGTGGDPATAALDELSAVIADCARCVLDRATIATGSLADGLGPVVADHREADFVVLPAVEDLGPIAAAVGAGSPALVVVGGDESAVDLVASGASPFHARVSLNWVAYAAVDQAVRAMLGKHPVADDRLGIGVKLFTPTNLPGIWGAEGAFFDVFDWVLEYLKLWGLD